jgi:uncharacterized protein
MASPELSRLWKLAQVDRALAEIRVRAAGLDVGQKIQAEVAALEKEEAEIGGRARALRAELTDLELAQKGFDDKLKKIDKEMYGGKVVNPREVENLEKEIAALKKQRGKSDDRIMELWDLLPPAEKAAADIQKRIEEKRQLLTERRKKALQEKGLLEADYKKYSALRPELAEAVKNPSLLARYDSIRQRHAGVGMAEVTRKNSCGVCGTNLPERTIQLLKDDKLVTCESCHRILYYTEGIV